MTYARLWTVEDPPGWRLGRRPAEVIWDADGAGALLDAARSYGHIVRGPYVLEADEKPQRKESPMERYIVIAYKGDDADEASADGLLALHALREAEYKAPDITHCRAHAFDGAEFIDDTELERRKATG